MLKCETCGREFSALRGLSRHRNAEAKKLQKMVEPNMAESFLNTLKRKVQALFK